MHFKPVTPATFVGFYNWLIRVILVGTARNNLFGFMESRMKLQGLEAEAVWDTMPTGRLLVVDDDAFLRATLMEQFAAEGFDEVYEAETLIETFREIDLRNPDLIILDIRLPDGNGIEICRKLRERGFAKPIIILTGQNAEQDIIASLEAGANDYVIKPMRLGKLLARVKSQLWQHKASDTARFSIGGLSFLPANKLLKSEDETRKVILTEKESTILKYLYRAHPNCVTKEGLLAEVWGFQNGLSTHTVETHIYRLRQKIKRLTKKNIILTGMQGYSLSSVP
ncbi:MAG: Transcriptional regulatory protein WalR [SAR116 cluster bacterium]|nr:MAG: Transcriptional regulatory protein WalR [SAR116 cluster bacterium]